ncbi:hypothetical protein ABZ725_29575 [Streptomyces sp. NPDC006872]|uniref:hypothetical protein n=1 Tax=Streptomyces sp. NPDC006872 TaxID=3155720 RepID=UPI0033F3EC5F
MSALYLPVQAVFGDLHWAFSFFSLLLGLFGFLMWSAAPQAKEHTTRLRQSGRPGVTEIIVAERIDPADGSADSFVRTLRISGADVPSFEAAYRGDYEERFQVGARFSAVVDPSETSFTLRRL